MSNWFFSGLLFFVLWWIPWQQESLPSYLNNHQLASCDLIVDAGPDTNVCYPGGLLTLMGSVTGNALFTVWSPSSGLSNPNILNPVANITGPITYTLTGWGVDPDNPNLVVNGDFELGNTGFTSDYTYVADLPGNQSEMVPEGTYTVINNPNLVHTGFSACNDHTPGSGVNMMVVNGAASLQDVWCQTIPVTANTWYNVSAWVASVNPSSPAILRFSINGTPIGPTINAPSTTCQWIPFNATWNSGSTTSATICILNLNTALGGNDFAIDDISMVSLCPVEDEVNITLVDETAPVPDIQGPEFLCAGDVGTYTVTFPPEPPILNYQWSVPPGATILSGQGTTQVSILWEDEQTGNICLMIETRCDENEECLEVIVGDVPDLPLISGPGSLCPGETATFYTQEQNPDDEYNWILPPEVTLINGEGTNEIEVEWANDGEAEICLEVTNECGTTDNCTFITLFPSYLTLFDTVLCAGTTITINGNTYGNGIWSGIENFTSINGCDSIVEIEISEATSLQFMFDVTLCPGDSIFLEGEFQTEEGVYIDSFSTITGCDSLVITEVFISAFDTTYITSTTCDPLAAGTTVETFQDGNCDSTVITQVILVESDTTILFLNSCLPADTGQTIQVVSNQAGCDSTIITIIALLPTDTTEIFQTSCDPSQIGVTTQNLTNVNGCDSTVITTVSFLLSDTTNIHTWTCTYSDTGTTSILLMNSSGCDSLVIHQTEYGGSDTTFLFSETCIPADSGWVFSTVINQFGCDSIVSTYFAFIEADSTFIFSTSCLPSDTGTFITNLININGCDSFIISNVTLQPIDVCSLAATYTIDQPLCFGDSATVHINIQTGLGPFQLFWSNGIFNGTIGYQAKGSYSFQLGIEGNITIRLTSSNGLVLLDTIYINQLSPLEINITSSDYSGWGVPCYGDSNGMAEINVLESGSPPLSYQWSNGDALQKISNLSEGIYFTTVTDNNGCKVIDSITITEPPLMQYDINVENITCFGDADGKVTLTNMSGGIKPWMISLDGGSFQNTSGFDFLPEGEHQLSIRDQNGCMRDETFVITEPVDWHVELGNDTTLPYGSIIDLEAQIIGPPQGMTQFIWSDGICDNCASRKLELSTPITLSVLVTDENGCTDEDIINIKVFVERDLFIPNTFSPNDDQVNDHFTIYSGAFLLEVEELTIFDRWGSMVFQKLHFQPDDPDTWWDGKAHEKFLNPGVYVYKAIVKFKDGVRLVKYGDITLVR